MNGGRYAVLFFRCHCACCCMQIFLTKKRMPKKYKICVQKNMLRFKCLHVMYGLNSGPWHLRVYAAKGITPIRLGSESGFEACRSTWGRWAIGAPPWNSGVCCFEKWPMKEVNTHDDSFFWTAPHAGFCFFCRNIERFRKIFGQLMIKCPARNRTMVFYSWFIVRRWEGNKILVIVSSKTPYNSLILIYIYLLLIAWCHVNKCHHIISSCYHLRSNYIACRYHTGIVVSNILSNKTYKHQCQGPCQVVFSDNLYLNKLS